MSSIALSLLGYLQVGGSLPETLRDSFSPAAFGERVAQEGFTSFIVDVEGELAGFVSLKGDDYLYHLFIAEAFHRQGLARALWLRAVVHSKSNAIKLRSSLYAVPTYLKLGFVMDGEPSSFASYPFQPMRWERQGRQPCDAPV